MKKIILSVLTLMIWSEAHALSPAECRKYSDQRIAEELLYSVALGAQVGLGNDKCHKIAKSLVVEIINEELSEATGRFVQSPADYGVLEVKQPTEATGFRHFVRYFVKTKNGRLTGDFTFRRYTDQEDIDEAKCASLSESPSHYFMLSSCK